LFTYNGLHCCPRTCRGYPPHKMTVMTQFTYQTHFKVSFFVILLFAINMLRKTLDSNTFLCLQVLMYVKVFIAISWLKEYDAKMFFFFNDKCWWTEKVINNFVVFYHLSHHDCILLYMFSCPKFLITQHYWLWMILVVNIFP